MSGVHKAITTVMISGSSTNRFLIYYGCVYSVCGILTYSATSYKLLVVNGYGQVMHIGDGAACDGFGNGDIIWDSQIDGKPIGTYIELRTYYFWLKLTIAMIVLNVS